jgi:hypothetical protein
MTKKSTCETIRRVCLGCGITHDVNPLRWKDHLYQCYGNLSFEDLYDLYQSNQLDRLEAEVLFNIITSFHNGNIQ